MAVVIILVASLLTAALIWWLHRSQISSRLENVERDAPLAGSQDFHAPATGEPPAAATAPPAPELPPAAPLPEEPLPMPLGMTPPSGTGITPDPTAEPWQDKVRMLRDSGDLDEALALAREYFPRAQAMQQAAVILRQAMRQEMEQHQPVDALLGELYDLALMADACRAGSMIRPASVSAFTSLDGQPRERYLRCGYQQLKLLNKSDIRHLLQLWGEPRAHAHGEVLLTPVTE